MKSLFKKTVISILTWQSKQVLKKYKPKVIAVTGSVGKTSTKDAIYSALYKSIDIRKNKKSFNSEIGTPLTILGLDNGWNNPLLWIRNIISGFFLVFFKHNYPAWLVLEIGADRPGDIANVAKWLSCDVVVITRIPEVPVHVEYFDSPEAVIKEKRELVKALKPDGVLILNADDPNVIATKEGVSQKIITFGITSDADIKASDIHVLYKDVHGSPAPAGMQCSITAKKESFPLVISGALGIQFVYPALVAVAVAKSQKFNLKNAIEDLSAHVPPPGRMRIVEGYHESTIIDDTYNASPVAMTEALLSLGGLTCQGKKIAVLGDMMEIGDFSVEEHKKMGELAASHVDILVTVGVRSHDMHESSLNHGLTLEHAIHHVDSVAAGNWLKKIVHPGDIILVKGSQSKRMEKVVEAIMAYPEKKKQLLVRQETEWQHR